MVEEIVTIPLLEKEISLIRNPLLQRVYPWGVGSDSDKANYDETKIRSTNSVGCFPGGVTPYGCEEMSGNVFEWIRSHYEKCPYDKKEGRENVGEIKNFSPVLRGGSFISYGWRVRCSVRVWYFPGYEDCDVGFRIVVPPFSLDSENSDL